MNPLITLFTCAGLYEVSRALSLHRKRYNYNLASPYEGYYLDRKVHFTNKVLVSGVRCTWGIDGAWLPYIYVFDDDVIFATDTDDMMKYYRERIVQRCVPRMMKF
jgi:hypothetical protein